MYRFMLAALALVAAGGAAAQESSAFSSVCEAKLAAKRCDCMVADLQQSRDGEIALETFKYRELPDAERRTAMIRMLDRHRVKITELETIKTAIPALLDAAAKKCT